MARFALEEYVQLAIAPSIRLVIADKLHDFLCVSLLIWHT